MTYQPGGFYRMCGRCGFQKINWETAKDDDGLYVCIIECFDGKHPQDLVRGQSDKQNAPNARSEPPETYLTDNEVTRGSL